MKKLFFVFVLFFWASFVFAQTQPKDVIRLYTDKVIEIINRGQKLERQEKAEYLKRELRKIGEEVFLFDVMARMTVGYKWRRFSPKQKEEFKELFIKLIEKNYFDKVMEYLDKIKELSKKDIVVEKQRMLSNIKAEVYTTIKYEDKNIPVKYRLIKVKGVWKVYDIYVEGVGLVQNYRKQFLSMLRNRTPEEFLKVLKEKIEEKRDEAKK